MREMKDSGIPWIGEIPSDWGICRVKHCFTRKNKKAYQENPVVLSLARSGVKVRDLSNNEGQIAESYYEYNPVEEGDLLLNPMDLYSGANCSISRVKGVISPAYVNLRYKENLAEPTFYDFFFKTQYWSMAMFAHGKGVSFDNRWTLGIDTLFNYYIPFPTIKEQQHIASFLETKCSEIDSVLEKTESSIEKYKKLKQSVIIEAVTKGVRGDRPMKDSGIEWMGYIPNNWTRDKIIRLFDQIGSGTTPKTTDESLMIGNLNWIQSGDINGSIIKSCKNHISEDAPKFYSSLKVYSAPFIIVAMYGASIGNVAVSHIDGCVNQACCVLNNSALNEEYAFAAIKALKDYLIYNAVGGGQPNISQDIIKSSWLPVPPVDEQKEIASYLNEKCSAIDSLIVSKQALVSELESYKKSLIYEFITGKKRISEEEGGIA